MYFSSRAEAGKKLAAELLPYKDTQTTIVALSDGGVVIAAQIAAIIHCPISLLLIEPIDLPGEHDPVAVINQDGVFTYNHKYSTGELEEFDMEYHHVIEDSKLEKLSGMHRLLGRKGLISKDLLQEHNIILTSDGM